MSIVVGVIDTDCDQANKSFFPPRVSLSTIATSKVGTLLGFSEYAPSNPPLFYRRITWSGYSEQRLYSEKFQYNVVSAVACPGVGVPFTVVVTPTFPASLNTWVFIYDNNLQRIPGIFTVQAAQPEPGDPTKQQLTLLSLTADAVNIPQGSSINVHMNQIGGARYDYSGSSEIDLTGVYLSYYSKNLSEMCDKADGLITSLLSVPTPNNTFPFTFRGWCGPFGYELCSPCANPYTVIGDMALRIGESAKSDTSNFWGSRAEPVGAPIARFSVTSPTSAGCKEDGTSFLACYNNPFVALLPGVPYPSTNFTGFLLFDHNFNAVLDEEYTEADALLVAHTYLSNGSVASHTQSARNIQQTSVNFTLTASNLLPDTDYILTYQIFDYITGSSTVTVNFNSGGSDTYVTSGTIPIPALGHSVQVRNPTITFA